MSERMSERTGPGRRLAKRSIVGTRVSVPVTGVPAAGQTLFVPAVIHSTRVLGLETSYCVFFATHDAELRTILPNRKEYRAEQMVGPGFQSVAQAVRRFAAGQRVFLTFKGREVSGCVVSHDQDGHVLVAIDDKSRSRSDSNSLLEPGPGTVTHVRRRLEDMRLLESRKSARLLDSDQDYSRLLHDHDPDDLTPVPILTHDQPQLPHAPITITQGRKRRTSDSLEDLIMDDCSAAMVLMSLSCSPKSPIFFPNKANDKGKYSHSWTSGSSADSGVTFDSPVQHVVRRHLTPGSGTKSSTAGAGGGGGEVTTSGSSRSTTPSPNSAESDADVTAVGAGVGAAAGIPDQESAVASGGGADGGEEAGSNNIIVMTSSSSSDPRRCSVDEGIHHVTSISAIQMHSLSSSSGTSNNILPPASSSSEHRQLQQPVRKQNHNNKPLIHSSNKKSILFTCTWPGCDAQYSSNPAIEHHVRSLHGVDAGEEDFYFTEIERNIPSSCLMDAISSSGSSNSSQSPVPSPGPVACFTFHGSGSVPSQTPMPTWSHLDMARPAHEDPEYQRQLKQQQHLSSPIAIPGMSFTHHAAFLPTPKNKFMRVDGTVRVSPGSSLLQVSPKSRVGRTRGESRKCRKVYGMESRDLWCTQCKWKKACTRFHD